MASCFLSPPNRYTLSDRVIGGVVQRADRGIGSLHQTFSFGDAESYSSGSIEQLPTKSTIGQKRLQDRDSLADLATRRATSVAPIVAKHKDLAPPTSGRKMKVSASRRERCRINQERYRKRHADNLDEGIRTLQEEIQEL
ncbi:hypothetical protein GQ600_10821 [Phytophthora cactorum]|nr:hypothetical protein GQ600_10821 [Phytophthora cactorum]